MRAILKYPRTLHLKGSALQSGDDPSQVSMDQLKGEGLQFVFEEKADGASAGVSFHPDDKQQILQCRGHELTGGPRERQFDQFKAWASVFRSELADALGRRYVLYGEWMGAKHSQFYDALPHLFLTYDLYDREQYDFLSTPARAAVLDGLPIVPIHVVHRGWTPDRDLGRLVGPSVYRTSEWRRNLADAAVAAGRDPDVVMTETDDTELMEGVYLKVETEKKTVGRYKYVRHGFLQTIADSNSHWASRPIIPNRLIPGIDIYAPTPGAHYGGPR